MKEEHERKTQTLREQYESTIKRQCDEINKLNGEKQALASELEIKNVRKRNTNHTSSKLSLSGIQFLLRLLLRSELFSTGSNPLGSTANQAIRLTFFLNST